MILIDGSQGEGGGQVLRTALALSILTGKPFRIDRIRARRSNPGLRRQHLAAVKAAAEISAADVRGAALESSRLDFAPGPVKPGTYHFAVGTAGSATLVLQTVLPPLLAAKSPSELTLEGGTHNPMAPPFEFLALAFLPLLERMGARVDAKLERHGFFPAGGGRVTVRIDPPERLQPLALLERGALKRRRARALVAKLPEGIAARELSVVMRRLGWSKDELRAETVADSAGPGNAVLLELEYEHLTEVFAAFGERGRKAEDVAHAAAEEAESYLKTEAPIGAHLADQLLIPLALAGQGEFRTAEPSGHARTNIETIARFLDVPIRAEPAANRTWLVKVG